jgi:hypothetical protein
MGDPVQHISLVGIGSGMVEQVKRRASAESSTVTLAAQQRAWELMGLRAPVGFCLPCLGLVKAPGIFIEFPEIRRVG